MVVAPTRQGRYRLAPAYDVLPTNSGQGYQEFVVGTAVVRVIHVVDGWRKHFAGCGVTVADLESLAERVDGDALLSQRRAFNPADYSARGRSPRRRSPFDT